MEFNILIHFGTIALIFGSTLCNHVPRRPRPMLPIRRQNSPTRLSGVLFLGETSGRITASGQSSTSSRSSGFSRSTRRVSVPRRSRGLGGLILNNHGGIRLGSGLRPIQISGATIGVVPARRVGRLRPGNGRIISAGHGGSPILGGRTLVLPSQTAGQVVVNTGSGGGRDRTGHVVVIGGRAYRLEGISSPPVSGIAWNANNGAQRSPRVINIGGSNSGQSAVAGISIVPAGTISNGGNQVKSAQTKRAPQRPQYKMEDGFLVPVNPIYRRGSHFIPEFEAEEMPVRPPARSGIKILDSGGASLILNGGSRAGKSPSIVIGGTGSSRTIRVGGDSGPHHKTPPGGSSAEQKGGKGANTVSGGITIGKNGEIIIGSNGGSGITLGGQSGGGISITGGGVSVAGGGGNAITIGGSSGNEIVIGGSNGNGNGIKILESGGKGASVGNAASSENSVSVGGNSGNSLTDGGKSGNQVNTAEPVKKVNNGGTVQDITIGADGSISFGGSGSGNAISFGGGGTGGSISLAGGNSGSSISLGSGAISIGNGGTITLSGGARTNSASGKTYLKLGGNGTLIIDSGGTRERRLPKMTTPFPFALLDMFT